MAQEIICRELSLNATAVSRISHNDVQYIKNSVRWLPRIFKENQKESGVNFAQYFLKQLENGKSSIFNMIVTADEASFLGMTRKLNSSSWYAVRKEQIHL